MRAVNLLPRDVQQAGTKGGHAPLLVAAGGAAAATAAALVMFLSASGSASEQQAQLDAVEAAIASIPKRATPAVAPGVIAQERSDRTVALAAALTTRMPVDRVLRDLAYVLPSDAWLTAFTASAPTAAATTSPGAAGAPGAAEPATGAAVTIIGATYSHSSVSRVLSRLAAMPTLDDVRLTASARATIDPDLGNPKNPTRNVVTFVISADLRTGSAT